MVTVTSLDIMCSGVEKGGGGNLNVHIKRFSKHEAQELTVTTAELLLSVLA